MSGDIKAIVAEFNEITATFRSKMQDKMNAAFAKFFVEYPEFRSIEWNQYTPYFNDGDPCEFRVGEFYYTLQPDLYPYDMRQMLEDNDYSIDDLDGHDFLRPPTDYMRKTSYYVGIVKEYDDLPEDVKAERARLNSAWVKMRDAISLIPDEVFLATFKDHSSVRVTKDGIDIEEYEHE